MDKIANRLRYLFGTRYHVHRVPETFGERFRMWLKNSLILRLALFIPFFVFMMTLADAYAFNFPWFKDYEARYIEATEARVESENRIIADLIAEFTARGDLAFDKAETAADEQNIDELNRLAGVAKEMQTHIDQLNTLKDNKDQFQFKVCFERGVGIDREEHCFSQALLK